MEQLTKCAAIYGYGLTVSGVAGFAGKGQDIFVCGAVKPGKDNILRVAYIQTVDFVFLLNITGAGAQIPDALGPVGLFVSFRVTFSKRTCSILQVLSP